MTLMVDGDNPRYRLNRDLGCTGSSREENISRIGGVAKLLEEAGLVLVGCSI